MKAELALIVTLLRGLALPKDMEQVLSELMPNLVEMCSHLVQVILAFVIFSPSLKLVYF